MMTEHDHVKGSQRSWTHKGFSPFLRGRGVHSLNLFRNIWCHTANQQTLQILSKDKLSHTHRAPNYPAQRIPGSFIKPVEELVEAI